MSTKKIVMRRIQYQPKNVVYQKTDHTLSKHEVTLKNTMVHDIIKKHANDQENEPQTHDRHDNHPIVLIPTDEKGEVTTDRVKISSYLIHILDCPHDSHVYSQLPRRMLIQKNISFFTTDDYGTVYPIISSSKLQYCHQCLPKDHEIITRSIDRGSVKFVTNKGFRQQYEHVVVPDYITSETSVYVENDDIWLNLSHPQLVKQDVYSLKDMIIYHTHRKNFKKVFALPPPNQVTTLAFEDFGCISQLATNEYGYDDEDLVIIEDDVPPTYDEYTDDYDDHVITIKRNDMTNLPNEKIDMPVSEPKMEDVPTETTDLDVIVHDQKPQLNTVVEDDEISSISTIDSERLIMNMITPDDFKHNIDFFKNRYGVDISPATIDEEILSINTSVSFSADSLLTLIDKLQSDGYSVSSTKRLTLYINREVVHKYALTVVPAGPLSSATSSQCGDTSIDKSLKALLIREDSYDVMHIVNIVEKTYLQRQSDGYDDPIVLDVGDRSACRNVSPKDIHFLFRYGPGYNSSGADPCTRSSYDLMLRVSIHLKFSDVIPRDLIHIDKFTITIY